MTRAEREVVDAGKDKKLIRIGELFDASFHPVKAKEPIEVEVAWFIRVKASS